MFLQKIYSMCIRGKLFRVIKSSVFSRRQHFLLWDSPSKEFPATSGVPKGSILRPLDTKAIQDDLNNRFSWTLSIDIPFNNEKCAHIGVPR